MKLLISLLVAQSVFAATKMVELNSQLLPPFRQEKLDSKTIQKTSHRQMLELKESLVAQNPQKCLVTAQKLLSSHKSLQPWISYYEMRCALMFKKTDAQVLASVLSHLESKYLISPTYKNAIRPIYFQVKMMQIEALTSNSRDKAWDQLEAVIEQKEILSDDEKAQLYQRAGEAAFVKQKLPMALEFFSRSLKLKDSPDLKKKLRSLNVVLGADPLAADVVTTNKNVREELEASQEENELYNRYNGSLQLGDFVAASDDGQKLLKKFAGSKRAKLVASKLLENYLSVSTQVESRLQSIREKLFLGLIKSEPCWQIEWIKSLYSGGNYLEAYLITKAMIKNVDSDFRIVRALLLGANSAAFVGEEKDARKWYQKLQLEFSGTPEALTSVFRLGLIEYKSKNYSASASQFERLLVLPNANEYELRARYWLWRSLQNIDPQRAIEQRETLITNFPLTYYGLRAKAEKENGNFSLPSNAVDKLTGQMLLIGSEAEAWEKIQTLLEIGFVDEAKVEIAAISVPSGEKEKALLASWFAASHDYTRALQLWNEVWEKNKKLIQLPFLSMAYPKENFSLVAQETKKYEMESFLALSLTRQESAFNPRAVSKSNALGLMQMIPPTAKEVAQALNESISDDPEDMFDINRNIRFGTWYLQQMIKKFASYIPAGVAAYNAGPHRLEKWLLANTAGRMRDANTDQEIARRLSSKTSDSFDEVWIDELPWEETSFYVKAVMRNLIVYRILDRGPGSMPNPIWKPVSVAQ